MPDTPAPFSARVRSGKRHVDNEFPATARVALLHLLDDLIRQQYVRGWNEVVRELARLARKSPANLSSYDQEAAEWLLTETSWDRTFDFCERLFGHLAVEVGFLDDYSNYRVSTSRSDVQDYVARELQRLFLEESFAFEFRDGLVIRRGRRHTVEKISQAELVLGDPRLDTARRHYQKALQFFRDSKSPDFENAVKEAVCAVEAAGKALFQESNDSTLGDLIKWLTADARILPKTLGQSFVGLYGFRSAGEGVGHGGTTGGKVSPELAEYVLSVAASQIILLVDLKSAQDDAPPF